MSYYDNPQSQWSSSTQQQQQQPPTQTQNNWEHQGSTTPVRAGASGPQPQDDYAFSYQFDEVDRAYENLQKSGKGYGMGGRHSRGSHHTPGSRPHSVNNFDDARGGSQGPNLQNFYANQRHQPSRGSNEAEQVMQAKRRMAAQRERELRNLHTEQQYQRTVLSEAPLPPSKQMSEEETRELIAPASEVPFMVRVLLLRRQDTSTRLELSALVLPFPADPQVSVATPPCL
ncbi:hypothetical protein NXS19_000296 [Fusarium pseudograminearum]|nr:hypothetical protein NXS19_000296 [Fusarium pseudograminearum]